MRGSRRRFLGAIGTGAMGLNSPYVGPPRKKAGASRPDVRDLDRAAAAPVLRLDGLTSPVIIESLRFLKKGGEHFVHVRSRDGAEGISVANPPRAEYLDEILEQLVMPFFVGKDARDLETLLWELYRWRDNYKLQGLALWSPQAWVEFAVLDMLGRIARKAMGALLGDVVRQEVACCPQAIKVGRMLEDVKAVYFEEPCPFDHLEDTKAVADALTIPVAGGEQEFSDWRFRWMIAKRGVDIVQPDLHYYGGMIRSVRVARMAALAQMPTTVHISGGFGFVYMLHFASCVPDIGRYQEYKLGRETYDWFDPPLKVKDGRMTVPAGPGVGIKDVSGVLKGAVEV